MRTQRDIWRQAEPAYVARSRNIRLSNEGRRAPLCSMEEIVRRYDEGYFKRRRGIVPMPVAPLDEDLGRAIEKMKEKEKILDELPDIDCGACGCPSCGAFAEDAVKGEIERDGCVVLRAENAQVKKKTETAVAALAIEQAAGRAIEVRQ